MLISPPQSPLAKGGGLFPCSLPFARGGLGWGKLQALLTKLIYPPQSPLAKGGGLFSCSLPFARGGLGWGKKI